MAQGDRTAFEEVYRRTSAKLFGICLRILVVRQEAEDALQDTYLSIWRRAGGFDATRGSAVAWLSVLARNAAIDRMRQRRGDVSGIATADEPADQAPLAWEAIGDAQEARRLHACLGTIDSDDAGMIRTAFLQGRSYAQIAQDADLPLGTVKSRIRRAFVKLRECLQ